MADDDSGSQTTLTELGESSAESDTENDETDEAGHARTSEPRTECPACGGPIDWDGESFYAACPEPVDECGTIKFAAIEKTW